MGGACSSGFRCLSKNLRAWAGHARELKWRASGLGLGLLGLEALGCMRLRLRGLEVYMGARDLIVEHKEGSLQKGPCHGREF